MNKLLIERIKNLSQTPKDNRKVILIVDFMNLFFRNYMMNKTLDPQGYHCGGILGTVTSLKYVVKTLRPDKIFVCYEGKNSTKKRKEINENYKSGRVGKSLSPFKEQEYILEQPEESFQRQIFYVKEMLTCLPLINLEITELEADDLISYICYYYKDEDKIISSNDQDFYQLIDKNTRCFNPIEKKFVDINYLLEKFSIHPNNFLICKAIKGDDSDNLKGVKGIGYKFVIKMFPFLKEEKIYMLDDIFLYCEKMKYESTLKKKFESILENKKTIEDNYKIMNLKSELDNTKQMHINDRLHNELIQFDFEKMFTLFSRFNATRDSLKDFSFIFSRYSPS